eukprot:366544-Chlamydomonas_euryale.AAC.2
MPEAELKSTTLLGKMLGLGAKRAGGAQEQASAVGQAPAPAATDGATQQQQQQQRQQSSQPLQQQPETQADATPSSFTQKLVGSMFPHKQQQPQLQQPQQDQQPQQQLQRHPAAAPAGVQPHLFDLPEGLAVPPPPDGAHLELPAGLQAEAQPVEPPQEPSRPRIAPLPGLGGDGASGAAAAHGDAAAALLQGPSTQRPALAQTQQKGEGSPPTSAANEPWGGRPTFAADEPWGSRPTSAVQQPGESWPVSGSQHPGGDRPTSAAQQSWDSRPASAAQPLGGRWPTPAASLPGNGQLSPAAVPLAKLSHDDQPAGAAARRGTAAASAGDGLMIVDDVDDIDDL